VGPRCSASPGNVAELVCRLVATHQAAVVLPPRLITTAIARKDAAAAKARWRKPADEVQRRRGARREIDARAEVIFPTVHRVRLPATNPLCCRNGGAKRYTDVIGMVANEVAITRATTSVHDGAGAHGSPAPNRAAATRSCC
jgi:hypothetical protein